QQQSSPAPPPPPRARHQLARIGRAPSPRRNRAELSHPAPSTPRSTPFPVPHPPPGNSAPSHRPIATSTKHEPAFLARLLCSPLLCSSPETDGTRPVPCLSSRGAHRRSSRAPHARHRGSSPENAPRDELPGVAQQEEGVREREAGLLGLGAGHHDDDH
uniref:Uncharacterized protein n=1 Tax=Aegilops tauschii subsp. strangulata TaxID=200361 RepID=A0A453LFH6_AEGTS